MKAIMNMHISARNPNRKNAHKGGSGPLISTEYCYTIETGQPHYVLDIPKSTSTQSKFIKNTLTTKTMETSQPLTQKNSPTSIYLSVVSLVKRFLSQENEVVSTTPGVRSSLKSLGLLGKNNHAFWCLKTLKGFYLTTKGQHSLQSSPRLMSWGMTANGNCLTARITEYPKTAKECSLSDILEEHVDQKYFLSETQTKKILQQSTN